MKKTQLDSVYGSLEAYEQGAHLSSWIVNGSEQLFMSRDARYAAGVALRGGVPVCFPQFAAFGDGQKHGFARNVEWQLSEQSSDSLKFTLQDSEASRDLWPHQFQLALVIALAEQKLTMTLTVTNTGEDSFEFGAALHTYLHTEDVRQLSIEGLGKLQKWDNGDPLDQRAQDNNASLEIEGPIDRVYFDAPESLLVKEPSCSRRVTKSGFTDVVVWNPWVTGAQGLSDMADDEYLNMICVEAAVVDKPITLAPNQSWVGEQAISLL